MKKIIFLTALALLAGACGTSNEVKNTTANAPAANAPAANTATTTSEPPKQEVFTAGVDPRADVISATQKLQKLESWSAQISSETTPAAKAEMEFIAPDRYHIKKAGGEVIVIGNDSYENQKGKWKKLDDNIGEYINSQTKAGINEAIKSLKEVQIVGKEKVGDKDATIYQHINGEVKTKVWIADASGQILKNEVEAIIGGEMQKQTTVYNYDKKITIEAPKVD